MQVGQRVSDAENNYGTIRYIGTVAHSKVKEDVWIGVEWDDQSRGKHDGSCLDDNGVFHRYFECVFGAGSFVKETKLIQGRSFVDILYQRYKDKSEQNDITENYALTAKGNQKAIEFVGEENIRKWQQIHKMTQVTLPRLGISFAEDNIKDVCPHFTYVDIQNNLISSWLEVAKIALQIPKLEQYYILGNKMETITTEIVSTLPEESFKHIKTFCISKCDIQSWEAIEILKPFIDHIEELFVTHSDFYDLPLYDEIHNPQIISGFMNLKKIDISSSKITEWSQILSLGKLPALVEILADENPIRKTSNCPVGFFMNLARFSLTGILIEGWSDVDCFESYPSLTNLRLTDAPFLQKQGISESRLITIARVGRLSFLNGSPVNIKERNNAENTYVRRCIRDYDETADDVVSRVVASGLHPRFPELYKKYSADLVTLAKSKESNTIKSDLITVVLKNLSFISNGSLEPVTKKLPGSLQIVRLRQLVKQLFGLDPVLQQLSFRVLKDAPPVPLEDDDLTLAQYGVINGAEIFINEAKAF